MDDHISKSARSAREGYFSFGRQHRDRDRTVYECAPFWSSSYYADDLPVRKRRSRRHNGRALQSKWARYGTDVRNYFNQEVIAINKSVSSGSFPLGIF